MKRFYKLFLLMLLVVKFAFAGLITKYPLDYNGSIYASFTKPFILKDISGKDSVIYLSYGKLVSFNGEKFDILFDIYKKIYDLNPYDINKKYKLAYLPEANKVVVAYNYSKYTDTTNFYSKIFYYDLGDGGYISKDLDFGSDYQFSDPEFYKDSDGKLYLCGSATEAKCYLISDKNADTSSFGEVKTDLDVRYAFKDSDVLEYDTISNVIIYGSYISKNILNYLPPLNESYETNEGWFYRKNIILPDNKTPDNDHTYIFENRDKYSIIATFIDDNYNTSKDVYIVKNLSYDDIISSSDSYDINVTSTDHIEQDLSKYHTVYPDADIYTLILNDNLYLLDTNGKAFNVVDSEATPYIALTPLESSSYAIEGFESFIAKDNSIIWNSGYNGFVKFDFDTKQTKLLSIFEGEMQHFHKVLSDYYLLVDPKYKDISDDAECYASSCYEIKMTLYDKDFKPIKEKTINGHYASLAFDDEEKGVFCLNYKDMSENTNDHLYCYDKNLEKTFEADGFFRGGTFIDNYFIGNDLGIGVLIDTNTQEKSTFYIDDYMNVGKNNDYVVMAGRLGSSLTINNYKVYILKRDKISELQSKSLDDIASDVFEGTETIGNIYLLVKDNNIYLVGENYDNGYKYQIVKMYINDGKLSYDGKIDLKNQNNPDNLAPLVDENGVKFYYILNNAIHDVDFTLSSYEFTYELKKGWNLLGNPFENALFSKNIVSDNIPILWYWDKSSSSWEAYSNDEDTNNLIEAKGYKICDRILNGKGFWVKANSDENLTIKGIKAQDNNVSIFSAGIGWNLSGVSYLQDEIVLDEIDDVNGTKIIWRWEDGAWKAWSPDSNIEENIIQKGIEKLQKLKTGDGFWLYKE